METSTSRLIRRKDNMEKKWCLLKISDGERGAVGKQKVYEVTVSDNVLRCAWGMAEKAKRQTSAQVFADNQSALWAARQKVWSKVDRGYRIAYEV
jgi:predicted DNA-binding WGR domain protein